MIKALIFDIGGVLAFDVWENLLLDKKEGLASIYGLDLQTVNQVGAILWEQYAYQASSDWKKLEINYWSQFNNLMGCAIPIGEIIQLTDKFIKPVDGMAELLSTLISQNITLAICSNNTEFWFNRQAEKIGLQKYVSTRNIILSCRIGVSKSSPRFEMFEEATKAVGVNKKECVFIDDRIESIIQATQYGLTSIMFPTHSPYGARYIKSLLSEMHVL